MADHDWLLQRTRAIHADLERRLAAMREDLRNSHAVADLVRAVIGRARMTRSQARDTRERAKVLREESARIARPPFPRG